MSNIDPVRAIEPLTRNRKNGDRYERPEPVEAEIERVLELPLHEAFRLASSGGTRAQTLVYLLRRFRPNRPNAVPDATASQCPRSPHAHIGPLGSTWK